MYKDLKQAVADNLVELLRPIHERRASLTDDAVRVVLREGADRARECASAVVRETRDRIGLLR
jgi:hypothetical protein